MNFIDDALRIVNSIMGRLKEDQQEDYSDDEDNFPDD